MSRVIYFGEPSLYVPPFMKKMAAANSLALAKVSSVAELRELLVPPWPVAVVVYGDRVYQALNLWELKKEPVVATVPVMVVLQDGGSIVDTLQDGADEVVTLGRPYQEEDVRFKAMLRRSHRDLGVHPTTRLPGAQEVKRQANRRIESGESFALGYADIDSFKEFNDEHGFDEGDRVIVQLANILQRAILAVGPDGFVGHVGGDDFVFLVPAEQARACCDQVVTEFAKEATPLTLSIGVVDHDSSQALDAARVSQLAAQNKALAKRVPGSAYV